MNVVAPHSVRARACDAWADEYEPFRPGYPAAKFDLVAARPGLCVVDCWIARWKAA